MNFKARRIVRPEHLNSLNTVFGGQLCVWLDEELAMEAMEVLEVERVALRYMSGIDFASPAKKGDILEIGMKVTKFGQTSITLSAEIRRFLYEKGGNAFYSPIVKVKEVVMVAVTEDGRPMAHGKTPIKITPPNSK